MKRLQIFLVVIFLLIATPVLSAEYYSWEDENGTTVISNVPPPDNVKRRERSISEESDQANMQTEEEVTNQKVSDMPPPLVFTTPPEVVVIPSESSYVYMVPDIAGIYFYQGFWYRFHHHRWFRSDIYDGVWTLMGTSLIPHAVVRIPPEYPRYIPSGYNRIAYHNLRREWQQWDNSRHWHSFDWYKHESRPEIRKERLHNIEMGRAKEGNAGGYKPAASLNPEQKVKKSRPNKSASEEKKIIKPKVKKKKEQSKANEEGNPSSPELKTKPKTPKMPQGQVK
jgi:hypothetical protein